MSPMLRLATPADAAGVRAVYAPYCATPVSFEAGPPSVDEMRRRIVTGRDRYPWLVCDAGGAVRGYAYAGPHRERAAYRWSVDVSVYIDPARRRAGVGRALYTALFDLLSLQGFVNAYAGVTLPNPASVGLHTAVGFTPVGVYRQVGFKDDAWHDVGWFEKLLLPVRSAAPAEPLPVAAVEGSPAWAAALDAGRRLLRS